jgi:hypothetical protein
MFSLMYLLYLIKGLVSLNLTDNKVGIVSILYLADAIQQNTVLLILNLFVTNGTISYKIDTCSNKYRILSHKNV